MVGQVQLAFLLVIAVFANSDAAPLADKQNPLSTELLEYSVLLDEQFDLLLPILRSFILNNGLDPMKIIDISEPFLPDMPGKLKGQIDLKEGWVQNLSQIKRAGHVIAKYFTEKIFSLEMELGFDVMDCNYAYHLKYLLLDRKGDMYVRLYDLKTKVLMTADLNNYHVSLDSIKFTEVGKYDIKFEGNLLDPVLNIATKVVTSIFKKLVLVHIEKRSMQVIETKLNELIDQIPFPDPSNYDNFKYTLKQLKYDTLALR